jgi:hypothetical protein
MWLLNTHTLRLEAFLSRIPKYAILSHRWEETEELSFGDVTAEYQHLKGYQKVTAFCDQARSHHFQYVWMDTCCIDKKSSAELGEAINSMYMWYKQAAVCIVYLHDVDGRDDIQGISQSSWFTRGWTLQELIAPTKLHFYDRKWSRLASKHEISAELEVITGIPRDALQNFRHDDFCIAEKMSWAARRTTTREEDSAYCLLGIFDVNMPLLYGEGSKAFLRLQEEIMRTSTDLSILLWQGKASATNGMLAAAPCCFEDMKRSRFDMIRHKEVFNNSQGWDTNNAGISIRLITYPYLRSHEYQSIICAQIHKNFGKSMLGIFLQKLSGASLATASYRRITVHGKAWVELDAYSLAGPGLKQQQLFITRQALADYTTDGVGYCRVAIQTPAYATRTARYASLGDDYYTLRGWPISNPVVAGETDTRYRFDVNLLSEQHLFGHVVVTLQYRVDILVCFGCDRESRAICLVLPFCTQLYRHGLQAADLLDGFNALCGDSESDVTDQSQACEFFAITSNANLIESSQELEDRGIYVVLNGGVFADMHYATLSIEPDEFLRYYFGSESVMLAEGKLAEYEQQLDGPRRNLFKIASEDASI